MKADLARDGKIPLLYIHGSGHSGSTLLDLVFGAHSQVESVGEYSRIWRIFDPPLNKLLCSCGREWHECVFWAGVRQRADAQLHFTRGSKIPTGLKEASGRGFVDNITTISRAVLAASGKSVLCDSSKSAAWLRAMAATGNFRITVVHLVRDGRAVAFSNLKKGRSYWSFLRKWGRDNYGTFKTLGETPALAGLHLIRYEDFVREPQRALEPVLADLSLAWEPAQLQFSEGVNHNVAGNHMRRSLGQPIRFDARYLELLGPLAWYGGYAVAFRAMGLHRYPFWRKSP
jgi:hypothetical protein